VAIRSDDLVLEGDLPVQVLHKLAFKASEEM
jgi:hypothetical protein